MCATERGRQRVTHANAIFGPLRRPVSTERWIATPVVEGALGYLSYDRGGIGNTVAWKGTSGKRMPVVIVLCQCHPAQGRQAAMGYARRFCDTIFPYMHTNAPQNP